MFEKTLTDVVKGIRASKRDTALYISQCIAEIKTEIHSNDTYVKANALQKLTFLHMMGYSMNWASFATIEVMSAPRFAHKRVGYLAASQGFTQHTEVILLTTNLLKKELRGAVGGKGVYEAGLAINCIANIVTEDLATDLLPELTNLTQHPQPYLRKKAILCLYKVFLKYPQGLRLTFARLQQCLDDPNPAVVSCAVNVITELSDKNPRNYLSLAPAFFKLLTESSNNWMLIKVVKLLGSLVPEEPRLARKLLEPLAKIVQQTQAKSLLYEAVHTITLCLPYCRKADGSMPAIVPEIVTLCAQTLRTFVKEPDQNLKYLGLVGFGSLMKSHPKVLSASEYRHLILACLNDKDVTIRTRALDLLPGLVTRKHLVDLVSQLLEHVPNATGPYRLHLVAQLIAICKQDKYGLVADFGWYLDVLLRLAHNSSLSAHAELLRAQILDVTLRVLPVRPHAVAQCMQVLVKEEASDANCESNNGEMEGDNLLGDNGRGKNIMPAVLPAIAWIVGEYADLIAQVELTADVLDSCKGKYHALIHSLTWPWHTQRLPTTTQKVYVQASLKVLAAASSSSSLASKAELEACVQTLHAHLPIFTQSTDVEVVERAFTGLQLLKSLGLHSSAIPGLAALESDSDDDGPTADLLGLDGNAPITTKPTLLKSSDTSLASKVKKASPMLNYLLKPSAMKPIGVKAQRKKRSNPLGHKIDLDAPSELSIFSDLIDQELSERTAVTSLESVSFTQQKPRRVEEIKAPVTAFSNTMEAPVMQGFGSDDVNMGNVGSGSFQKPITTASIGSTARQRHGDPFYLDSKPSNEGEMEIDNKLSAIQLDDSDEDSPKKNKKVKKKKLSKKDDVNLWDVGLGTPSMVGSSAPPTIYDSADDEEDTGAMSQQRRAKEYDHLARIDLTTPLREDEVMPERKHRTVDPSVAAAAPNQSSKKPKKNKKKSKKKDSEQRASVSTEFDLLDLGGFGGSPAPSLPLSTPMSGTNNSISNAFDDLLTLSMSTPTAQSQSAQKASFTAPNSEQNAATESSKLWSKASLKLSKQSGVMNWSMVRLLYRIEWKPPSNNFSVVVVFRLKNSTSQSLSGVVLHLNSGQSVQFPSAAPGATVDSQVAGPLPLTNPDQSSEQKGSLSCNDSTVPFKMALPATAFLSPVGGLALDKVAQELSSGIWASASAKIECPPGVPPALICGAVQGFFQAAPVQNSSTENSWAFAATSMATGAQIRIFLKLKGDICKVEIRCTSPSLGTELASDAKRCVLQA